MNPLDTASGSVLVAAAGAVCTITLNRPAALNALDFETLHALLAAVRSAIDDASVRVLVLRGEGRSFCGGGDVLAMQAHRDDLPAFVESLIDPFHALVLALVRSPKPVVAAVHGPVAGGGISLALAGDLVLAAGGTRFVTAYAALGAAADGGLTFQLARRLGRRRALEALTLQTTFGAEEAHALGLVNRVVEAERLDEEAAAWARRLTELPPQTLAELKLLTAVHDLDDLQAQLDREKAAFLRCAATPEFAQRVQAYAQRSAGGRRGS